MQIQYKTYEGKKGVSYICISKELKVNQVRSNYAQMPFRQARACKTSEAHLILRGREFCLVKSGKAQVMNILQRIPNTIVSTTLLVTY